MVFSPTSDTPFAAIVVACCTSAAVSSRPFGGKANPTPRGATLIPTGAGVVTLNEEKCARISRRHRFVALPSSPSVARRPGTAAAVASTIDGVRKLSPGRSAAWTPWCFGGPTGGGGGDALRVRFPG